MDLTVRACKSSWANTGIVVNAINASTLVKARGGCAIFIIGLAVVARESTLTFTPEMKLMKCI